MKKLDMGGGPLYINAVEAVANPYVEIYKLVLIKAGTDEVIGQLDNVYIRGEAASDAEYTRD